MKSCNMDLLIAGCSTNCRHCYADGGPAREMSWENIAYLFRRMSRLNDRLLTEPINFSVTLDNEPANHSEALAVYRLAEECLMPFYYHHGSTTGLPYLRGSDRNEILTLMRRAGWNEVSLCIHGGEVSHNRLVNHPTVFQSLVRATKQFREHGFRLGVSLMLSTCLIEGLDQVQALLERLDPDFTLLVVPLHAPTKRMRDYLELRPTLEQCVTSLPQISQWGIDPDELIDQLNRYHLDWVMEEMTNTPFEALAWPESRDRVYYSIHPNLDLFYGNTGDERKKIGNLRELSDEDLIESLLSDQPNETFTSRLSRDDLRLLYDALKQGSYDFPDWVFPDLDSALCCLYELLIREGGIATLSK